MTLPDPDRPRDAAPPSATDGLAERLDRLSHHFQELVRSPARPDSLAGLRTSLDALRREAERRGREELTRVLDRLALLLEVWECLATTRLESAAEVVTFCARAVKHLAGIAAEPPEENRDTASWILQESSARWNDYLSLLDPSSTLEPIESNAALDEAAGADADADFASPIPPPAIDAQALFQMLTGGSLPPGSPALAPPGSSPLSLAPGPEEPEDAKQAVAVPVPSVLDPVVSRRPEGEAAISVPDIDPECREAFLAESLDLFERIEPLVLNLGRGSTGSHENTLTELRRCFHTLKGAAGSVGLLDLASRIHCLEQQIEDAPRGITPELLDELHQALSYLERVLDVLRKGPTPSPGPCPCPTPTPIPEPVARGNRPEPNLEERTGDRGQRTEDKGQRTVSSVSLAVAESRPGGDGPQASPEAADGPVRVAPARMDELMDLASELILRRGAWTAQAERLKQLTTQIRSCRNELRTRLDRLDELGITRVGAEATSDLVTVVLRLAEQVEDLVVLTESVQTQALPLADDSDMLARLTLQLWESLQSIRIVPVRGLFQRLVRVAHDAARVEGRSVEVEMIGEETGLDRAVQDKAFEPLLHIVRNAVGHGIESPADRASAGKPAAGRVTLEARRDGNTLVLSVQDDGRGLDHGAIAEKGRRLGLIGPDEVPSPDQLSALIFRPGFSTRQEANAISGRGVGMDVVAQEVRRLRGTIDLTSQTGVGSRITLRLPARLALEQAMITRIDGQAFAIPIRLIEHAQPFERGDVEGTGSHASVRVRDRRVPLIVVREALGFSTTEPAACPKLLLARAEGEPLALVFDAVEGTRELVIKPLGPLLAGHPVIWGTSLSLTGDVIFVLNPSGLFRWLCDGRAGAAGASGANPAAPRPAPVLVVDDSISVRRVVSRQLRMLGLDVEEVSNGVEALGKLSSRSYSMVLTDLEMPRMDGFELLTELRRSPALAALPVIVASTESRLATRRRVLALGARAFVPKPIDQEELARVAGALLNRPTGFGFS
jgi:chemotaxis protein histidine kinase CheA/ActR/RegA family two-component response regulator